MLPGCWTRSGNLETYKFLGSIPRESHLEVWASAPAFVVFKSSAEDSDAQRYLGTTGPDYL